jgi:hypothetical protein
MSSPGEPSSTAPAPPPPPSASELLAQLRLLENQLYSAEVVAEVKQLDASQQQEFAAARIHLTTVITQLSTAQLADIRQQLEAEGPALQQGIDNLNNEIARMENVTAWAGAVNDVIGLIGQFVPLL